MDRNDDREHDRLLLILYASWTFLEAMELIRNLADDFKYDSMHVFQTLDLEGYKKYIEGKFESILNAGITPKVSIVRDPWMGGNMLKLEQGRTISYLRMKCRDGKIYKLDMCDF